jgi:hypothetical protein
VFEYVVGYFTMLTISSLASNERTTDGNGQNLEGNGHGIIKILSCHLPGRVQENQEKLMAVVLATL